MSKSDQEVTVIERRGYCLFVWRCCILEGRIQPKNVWYPEGWSTGRSVLGRQESLFWKDAF